MTPPDPRRAGPFEALRRRISRPTFLSPQARSTARLAVVAFSVLATVVILVVITLQARRSEEALAETTARTLHDYTGYAGRLMGSDILRRSSEQRARVLAPVIGSVGRSVSPPRLDEIVTRAERELASRGADSGRGYFRLDLATGSIEGRGIVRGAFADRIADTLRLVAGQSTRPAEPAILALLADGLPVSVAYASLRDSADRPVVFYGFTYSRALGIAHWAGAVFRDTPLLPPSFAGQRWNYDTSRVQPGEVLNDALLSMRITDRAGHPFWQSPGAPSTSAAIRERTVISTAAGGMVVETTLLAGSEPALVPAALRRAQRWWIGAVSALALMLAAVSLLALRSERAMARGRRAEAMEQLSLGLRHELNNALATVLLNAELLRERGNADPAVQEQLVAITEQAERMRDVLRRLERRDGLDVIVPYLDEGFMVDLSSRAGDALTPEEPRGR
jgi:signal transduction histidine kinase